MITGDFYPTITPPGTSYLTEFTDLIQNLTVSDPDKIAEPYYMGYIPYDELPSTYKISQQNINADNDIIFVDSTVKENAPWFYTGRYYTNLNNRYSTSVYRLNTVTQNFELTQSEGLYGSGAYGFINSAEVATLTTASDFMIHFTVHMQESDGTYVDWWNDFNNAWHHFNIAPENFIDFMNGTYAIHFSFNQYGTSGAFDMYYNDLKNGTYTYIDSDSGRKLRLFITAFDVPGSFRDYDSSNTGRYYSDIYAATILHIYHDQYGVLPYIINRNIWHYDYANHNYLDVSTSGGVVTVSNRWQLYTDYLCGGWSGTIPSDFWSSTNGTTEVIGNMVATVQTSIPGGRIYRLFTPDDIMRAFVALFTRIFKTGSQGYGYSTGKYWPVFNADNTPQWRFIDGDFVDVVSDLRPWQISNIQVNDFTPDDIPPYGAPDEGENVGDRIRRPASLSIGGTKGFITQYAMSASQIAELGQVLWTSVFNADYWQNFMFSLALDTGSFSLSALLNFFLSLKVYPFSMINVPSYSSFGQDMYFGTGIKELHFSTNLHTINDYADYISGGYCQVWSNNFFGDFRDYINTEITLFVPYCGTIQLNPGDVVGHRVSVEYAIDFATGGCIAYVDLETGDGAGYPIAALHGQIGADVPLTATAAGEVAARFVGDAANVAGLIGDQAGKEVQAVTGALSGHVNPTPGSIGFAFGGPIGGAAGFAAGLAPGLGGQALGMLTRGAVAAPILSGGRGFASFGAPQVPYIQIRRGIYPQDANLQQVAGQPAAAGVTISSLSGFVKGSVKLEGMQGVTQQEQAEIKAAIEAGIFV